MGTIILVWTELSEGDDTSTVLQDIAISIVSSSSKIVTENLVQHLRIKLNVCKTNTDFNTLQQ